MENLTLRDGSKIAIIGGGPAGSFFAYFAQKFALEQGIRISTTIFDGKDFLQKGPRGCNLCAGVIANSLVQKLSQEGISFPEKRIINRVNGYCLHIENESLLLTCEETGLATRHFPILSALMIFWLLWPRILKQRSFASRYGH